MPRQVSQGPPWAQQDSTLSPMYQVSQICTGICRRFLHGYSMSQCGQQSCDLRILAMQHVTNISTSSLLYTLQDSDSIS